MIQFAETYKSYPDGQQNVGSLPESIMDTGFIPETAGARGQPLPAQWLNWMFQKLWRYINRDKVSDASGTLLFTQPDSVIQLYAVDRAAPAKYILAVGYKPAGSVAHVLTVVNSNGLTLGAATVDGNQPVNGGTDVVICATSRQFGDL